jgi:hypothetical protein
VTAESDATTIVQGDQPTVVTAPKVTASCLTFSVSTGRWSRAGATVSYQWLRDGVAIDGADGSTYAANSSDFNTALSVRVTAKLAGYAAGQTTIVATPSVTGCG